MKLKDAPFKIGDKVYWRVNNIKDNGYRTHKGEITDAYYQFETKGRVEGWRVLIYKYYSDNSNTHLEKYFHQTRKD